MNPYWTDLASQLNAYTPGEQPKLQNLIKLNTNENPYGPSPKVIDAIQSELGDALRLYPDPNSTALRTAIAEYYQVNPQQVFIGNGSDEVLAHLFPALLKHRNPILFPDISYSFYPVYCGLFQVNYETIALTDAFTIDIATYHHANGGILFPNPNAPTGIALPLDAIAELVANHPESVVVIDEAYVDFGAESAVGLVQRYPNLVVVQTFSKSRSLAGLRVGFAIAQESLIEALDRVKNCFNSYPLDRLASAGAIAAIRDTAYFESCRQNIMRCRDNLATQLGALGFVVLPSTANFLFASHPRIDASVLCAALRQRSILVRHFPLPRIQQFLRISIGTEQQCNALLKACIEILQPSKI